MKYRNRKNSLIFGLAAFLLLFAVAAWGASLVGDGNMLKRSPGELCSACHRTNTNTPSPGEAGYNQTNWDNAIKMHSAEIDGTCSDTTYKTKTACLAANATNTWTPKKWAANGGWGVSGGKYGQFTCTTCHTAHDTTNIFLIKQIITAPDAPTDNFPGSTVDFRYLTGTAGSAPYVMGDDSDNHTTSTRVCEVCHTITNYHRYDTTAETDKTHNNAVNCASCHEHTKGFFVSCTTCHGASGTSGAPLVASDLVQGADATGSTDPGKHKTHTVDLNMPCTRCHTGYVMPNGEIDLGFDNYGSGGGSYAGATNETYIGRNGTTILTPDNSKSCSNIYCHSQGTAATAPYSAPNVTPTWLLATTLPADCTGCHNGDQNASVTMSSGSHTAHVKDNGIDCEKCHSATVTNSRTIGTPANHDNHFINIAFDPAVNVGGAYDGLTSPMAKVPGSAYGACTNITCHSNGTAIWTGGTGVGNTPTWGSTAGCNACHGNTTYGDWRMAAPLYASGSPKPNAHVYHIDSNTTPDGPQCANCHSATTSDNVSIIAGSTTHTNGVYNVVPGGTYASGDNIGGASTAVSITYLFTGSPTASTCSNVSCHPTGTAGNSTVWSNGYNCTDCHNIDMTSATGYHHAMNNTGVAAGYPTAVPSGDALTGTNAASRNCLMCHVDHNIFSNKINSANPNGANSRAYVLRTSIATAPTTTTGFANSDYATGGGICISCHQNALTKSGTNVKTESGSTTTPVVTDADFSTAAHNYDVPVTMTSGGTFQADCSKCHDAQDGETASFQSGSNKAGVHNSALRRLEASLGITTPADPLGANFCFRCHSTTTDTNPGGGPAKVTAGKDYYGVATMSGVSEVIFTTFQKTYAHPVSTTSGLHHPGDGSAYNDGTLSGANRHVACEDCHNPHAATAAVPLKGATGVTMTNPTTDFAVPTSANYAHAQDASVTVTQPDGTTGINLDYKVCLKCHSDWAYGTTPPTSPSGGFTETNMAQEFNVNNWSYHYVEGDLTASVLPASGTGCNSYGPAIANNTPRTAGSSYGNFNSTWISDMEPTLANLTDAQRRSSKLRCGSCHGPDGADGGVSVPEGPHGSANAFILKVPSGSPYTTWNSSVSYRNNSGSIWCFNCHDPSFTNTGYGRGTQNLHTSRHNGRPCQNCHVAIPHGWMRYKFLRFVDCDSAPYNGTGNTGFHSGVNWKTSGNWTENDCHSHGAVAGCG